MVAARPVIRCEVLSKQYTLGRRQVGLTLRDAIADAVRSLRSSQQRSDGRRRETFWALEDVSFEIGAGEVVGIIGRNGAGKSTLLKILARITEPTTGRARIRGRLGSLLEVGTGFHGELTGRDNIYLNGAILGMKRSEIDRKFDEIVAFSEIASFLDTPVKRYSSGMTVRLAFAVAAHLEPEILLVDEVLAVGDTAFQRKCIGKMSEVADEGRTVLFVSHNMAIIQALCRRGILLDEGRLISDSPIDAAVATYLRSVERVAVIDLEERQDRRGWGYARLARLEVSGQDGEQLATGRPARFAFHVRRSDEVEAGALSCSFTFVNNLGHPLATLNSEHGAAGDSLGASNDTFICDVDALPLLPGRYRIDVEIHGRSYLQDALEGAALFDVEQGIFHGRPTAGDDVGDVAIAHRWIVPPSD
jgi:lipopolysaccharide transport system ATP-binding protein